MKAQGLFGGFVGGRFPFLNAWHGLLSFFLPV
jgi:hypothetical protein